MQAQAEGANNLAWQVRPCEIERVQSEFVLIKAQQGNPPIVYCEAAGRVEGRAQQGAAKPCVRSSVGREDQIARMLLQQCIEAFTNPRGRLRKTTRLVKYLRDIKTTFTCPSVLLTTLLGERITVADAFNTADFADVPTTLRTIITRLDDWLQANPTQPTVRNPVLVTEVFSDAWDDTRYANFRDRIHTYRTWIDEAYEEADRDESILKWRRVFGDEFAAGVVVEKGERAADEASLITEVAAAGLDLVTRFARLGRLALPRGFDRRLAHKQRPIWRALETPAFRVRVEASVHTGRNGVWLETLGHDHAAPQPKGRHLNFKARTQTGLPLAGDYAVHWRVTNTDAEARRAGCLRGGFERSNEGSTRWEELSYRGVHTVEAFVVRQRDSVLVAQSEPFYVVVE